MCYFSVEDFAEAIGVTRQTVNNLESKKAKLSATQYIAVAALTDSYFANHAELLPKLKAIIDGGDEYETSFRDDSLLKRWFEDFIDFDDAAEIFPDNKLCNVAREYKIFLDAEIFATEDASTFVDELTAALQSTGDKAVMPLRSIEQLKAEASSQEFCRAMTFINCMQADEILQIHGEYSDPNFHDTVIKIFKRFRDTYKICLVTPNEQLARDALALNDSATETDFKITAGLVVDGEFNFVGEEFLSEADFDDAEPIKNFVGWEDL